MGLLGLEVIRESVVLRIDTGFKGVIVHKALNRELSRELHRVYFV